MMNTLRAKLLAGLVVTGGAYYITPPRILAKIGIEKAFTVEDFTVTDLEGKSVTLSDCIGRPVLVYIWQTSCPASIQSVPMVETLYQKYKYTQLCFLPVSTDHAGAQKDDARQVIKAFADQHQLRYPVYKGWGYLPIELYASEIPFVYLIDRKGVLRRQYVMLPDHRGKLETDISAMLYDGSPESKISMTDPVSPELLSEYDEEINQDAGVKQLLDLEQFDRLDAMADDLRATKARFKWGKWKLRRFYDALIFVQEDLSMEQKLQLYEKWSTARPGSITARVAAGYLLVNSAENARGTGYAKDVSDENMKLYEERLAKARVVLEEAEKLPAKCPTLYNVMLRVAHGQGWGRQEYEDLFKKAVALEPLYTDFYESKAYYLLPQWYGSAGEWEKFAEESAEATKDSEGMGLYRRILVDISPVYGENGVNLFKETKASWPKMRQGFIDVDKKYPDSLILLNSFAWYACIAGDKETAKAVFSRIGDRYAPVLWKNKIQYSRWRSWANETKDASILNKFEKFFSP